MNNNNNTIEQTQEFKDWLSGLRDPMAKAAVARRIERAQSGNFGDAEPVGDGLSEMRIDVGKGYRVYYGKTGAVVYLLLTGGDKSTQEADIKRAKKMWKELFPASAKETNVKKKK